LVFEDTRFIPFRSVKSLREYNFGLAFSSAVDRAGRLSAKPPRGAGLTPLECGPQPWLTVVGLVPDLSEDPNHPTHDPMIYLPFRAVPRSSMHVPLRTRVAPAALADAVRGEVQSLDMDLPVQDVFTLEDFLSRRTLPVRLYGGNILHSNILLKVLFKTGMGDDALCGWQANRRSVRLSYVDRRAQLPRPNLHSQDSARAELLSLERIRQVSGDRDVELLHP
jgi:hypothetical protein